MEPSVLIMGGTGFLGQELGQLLASKGCHLHVLTRRPPDECRPHMAFPCKLHQWDGRHVPLAALEVDAVVNLVGHPIADQRWNARVRRLIRESRVHSVRALKAGLAELPPERRPQVIVQASAVGYYQGGDPGALDEDAGLGSGFLAEVCHDWESEAAGLEDYARLVVFRIGLILGWTGGALPKLWDIYAAGLGAVLGSGKQMMNWIHVDDLTNMIAAALIDDSYQGAYNAVAPGNVDNATFHRELCRATPSFPAMPAPGIAVRTLLGTRAQLVLGDIHVIPARLLNRSFDFQYFSIELALNELISQRKKSGDHYLNVKQWLPVGIDAVWEFCSSPRNLERITPGWLRFQVDRCSSEAIGAGSVIDYSLKLHGVPVRWRSEISSWQLNESFSDTQLKGPYRRWFHRHLFAPLAGGVLIEDRVEFALPIWPLSGVVLPWVRGDLEKIFAFRKQAMAEALA